MQYDLLIYVKYISLTHRWPGLPPSDNVGVTHFAETTNNVALPNRGEGGETLWSFGHRLMSPQGQSANTTRQTKGFPTRGNGSWLLFQHKGGHAKLIYLQPLRASLRSDGVTTLFLCSIYISCAVVPRYAPAWYRLLCCVSKTLSRLMLNGVHINSPTWPHNAIVKIAVGTDRLKALLSAFIAGKNHKASISKYSTHMSNNDATCSICRPDKENRLSESRLRHH